MTKEQIIHLAILCEEQITNYHSAGFPFDDEDRRNLAEALETCAKVRASVDDNKERALVWLGFVQGILYSMSLCTITEVRLQLEHNEAGQ